MNATDQFQKIQSVLSKKKKLWMDTNPICVFCGHGVTDQDCTMAHLIRRSESIPGYSLYQLQTMDINLGLSHFDCHEIFDNDAKAAVYLPKILSVLKRIRIINQEYYFRLMNILNPYWPKEEECKQISDESGVLYMQVFSRKLSTNY